MCEKSSYLPAARGRREQTWVFAAFSILQRSGPVIKKYSLCSSSLSSPSWHIPLGLRDGLSLSVSQGGKWWRRSGERKSRRQRAQKVSQRRNLFRKESFMYTIPRLGKLLCIDIFVFILFSFSRYRNTNVQFWWLYAGNSYWLSDMSNNKI